MKTTLTKTLKKVKPDTFFLLLIIACVIKICYSYLV